MKKERILNGMCAADSSKNWSTGYVIVKWMKYPGFKSSHGSFTKCALETEERENIYWNLIIFQLLTVIACLSL